MKEGMQERTEQNFWEDLRSGKFAKMIKEEARGQLLNGPHEVFHIVKPIFAENDERPLNFGEIGKSSPRRRNLTKFVTRF